MHVIASFGPARPIPRGRFRRRNLPAPACKCAPEENQVTAKTSCAKGSGPGPARGSRGFSCSDAVMQRGSSSPNEWGRDARAQRSKGPGGRASGPGTSPAHSGPSSIPARRRKKKENQNGVPKPTREECRDGSPHPPCPTDRGSPLPPSPRKRKNCCCTHVSSAAAAAVHERRARQRRRQRRMGGGPRPSPPGEEAAQRRAVRHSARKRRCDCISSPPVPAPEHEHEHEDAHVHLGWTPKTNTNLSAMTDTNLSTKTSTHT